MISLKNIKKVYKSNNIECKALDGLSLELPEKGLVAVFGASGCGKSTLLNIIGGLDSFDSGEFIFEGKNVKEFSRRDWDSYRNQHVGFVFQNYNLFSNKTAIKNVTLGLTSGRHMRKDKAEAVGMEMLRKEDFRMLAAPGLDSFRPGR